MSMKLLPASVDPVDPQASDVSTSPVPLTQRAITTRDSQVDLVPSADAFAWSSSTRRSGTNVIYGTPVEDSDSNETGALVAEYVSAWAGSNSVERAAIAHYLFYAAGRAGWSRWLINVYA
jgi:hypothetical protein